MGEEPAYPDRVGAAANCGGDQWLVPGDPSSPGSTSCLRGEKGLDQLVEALDHECWWSAFESIRAPLHVV